MSEHQTSSPMNADPVGKIVLQGYDPVAFHTEGKAVKGNPMVSAEYDGYKYLFATEANRDDFQQASEKYVPAYGGFCAFGITLGVYFPVEIDTWEMIDGRVMLQFNQDIKEKFAEDKAKNLAIANEK